jgi:hypothetical protein
MGRQVLQNHQAAAGHTSAGQNLRVDLPLDRAARLAPGRTLESLAGGHSTGGPLSCYRYETAWEFCPEVRQQQVAAWLSRGDYHRRAEVDHHRHEA